VCVCVGVCEECRILLSWGSQELNRGMSARAEHILTQSLLSSLYLLTL